eukprot:sb/3473078/
MDFEDKAGIVKSKTDWGSWYQSIDDVTIEVEVSANTKGKNVSVKILPSSVSCSVFNETKFSDKLFASIVTDESTWTIEEEDGSRFIRIFLVKCIKTPQNCWKSLFEASCSADLLTLDTMQKRFLQERYQRENPGFDFSGAEVTGQYQDGGPQFNFQ